FDNLNATDASMAIPTGLLENNRHLTVRGRAQYGDGSRVDLYAGLTINDVAPALSIEVPATITEGASGMFAFKAVDPGNDVIDQWLIDWGDGTASPPITGSLSQRNHSYADNGEFKIRLQVHNADG